MPRASHIPVSFVVEGDIDDAVVRKIAFRLGVDVHEVFVRNGKPAVLKALRGFNSSARSRPWFVLVDLDQDTPCAGDFVAEHLPAPSSKMRFRIAVRAAESWLLADREGFAKFFRVGLGAVSENPEGLTDPKQSVVDIARLSRKAMVRDSVPPRPGSGRRTGELYAALLIEYVIQHWDPAAARRRSVSLDRAMTRLGELAAAC